MFSQLIPISLCVPISPMSAQLMEGRGLRRYWEAYAEDGCAGQCKATRWPLTMDKGLSSESGLSTPTQENLETVTPTAINQLCGI